MAKVLLPSIIEVSIMTDRSNVHNMTTVLLILSERSW